MKQWFAKEDRRRERAAHVPPGEPQARRFETRTRSLAQLRDLQTSQAARLAASAGRGPGAERAAPGNAAASLPPEFRGGADPGAPGALRPTLSLLAHETGALDRRVAHPDRAAALARSRDTVRYPPHQVHHIDLGWGYDGVRAQQPVGGFKRSADRGIRYGESMRAAVAVSLQAAAQLNR